MRRLLERLFRRRTIDDELREEIDFHLQMRAELNQASGMGPEDAHRTAQKQFGNRTLIQEDTRRIYVGAFCDAFVQDLRHAYRTFLRAPSFTVTVILTLALGIGSTTAVFSVIDRILFRSLPYLGTTLKPSFTPAVRMRRSRLRSARSGTADLAMSALARCKASKVRIGSAGKGRRARSITSAPRR